MGRTAKISVAALVASAAVGAFVGSAGYTFHNARGTSYLSDDPKACVNCHIMQEQYDAWTHASHGRVATCNDCHVPHSSVLAKYYVKAEHGYRHSKGFTFQDFHEPIRITPDSRRVVVDNCVRCHQSIGDDLTVHAKTKGGVLSGLFGVKATSEGMPWGAGGSVGADCLHCHARVGHGPRR